MKSAGSRSLLWFRCRCALLLLLAPVLIAASHPTEYDVKLVYLYNFTKFVSWPDSAFAEPDSPINICVLGNLSEAKTSELLVQKKSRKHPIVLKLLTSLSMQDTCHILFFTKAFDYTKARHIINNLTTPTLLVGETIGFARQDGIIGFVTDDRRRVRIEINLANAKKQNLNIRAQLLEIAREIYRDEERS